MYQLIKEILPYESKLDDIGLSENPLAIELLKENPDKIDQYALLDNTEANELIKNKLLENLENNVVNKLFKYNNKRNEINLYRLSSNPCIFEYSQILK